MNCRSNDEENSQPRLENYHQKVARNLQFSCLNFKLASTIMMVLLQTNFFLSPVHRTFYASLTAHNSFKKKHTFCVYVLILVPTMSSANVRGNIFADIKSRSNREVLPVLFETLLSYLFERQSPLQLLCKENSQRPAGAI